MKLFRKVLFWIHLAVGLTLGLGIAMLAGTGALLAFEHPIVAWVERTEGAPPPGVSPTDKSKAWPITSLVLTAAATVPDASPSAVTADVDLARPLAVQFGRERVILLNNFTGKIVGTGAPRVRAFFSTVLDLHRWWAMQGDWRNWGRNITAAAALGFVLLIVSGMWLWMPRHLRWNALKPVLFFNRHLRGKARDWNWHNVVGFWLAVPMLVIALTGVIMAYPWANGLLFRAMGEPVPATRGEGRMAIGGRPDGRGRADGGGRADGRRSGDGNGQRREINLEGVDELWEAAESKAKPGWGSMSLRLGGRGGGEGPGGMQFVFNYGSEYSPLHRVTLSFDRNTGTQLGTDTFASQSPGRRIRSLIVPIHRGEIFGVPTMLVACVSSLGTLLLVYTGFALSWRRLVRPLLKRHRRPAMELTPRPFPFDVAALD